MRFTRSVSNIFVEDIKDGLNLFVACLEFNIGYRDLNAELPCCVVQKDTLSIFLFQSKEYADRDRSEMRLHHCETTQAFVKFYSNGINALPRSISREPQTALYFAVVVFVQKDYFNYFTYLDRLFEEYFFIREEYGKRRLKKCTTY